MSRNSFRHIQDALAAPSNRRTLKIAAQPHASPTAANLGKKAPMTRPGSGAEQASRAQRQATAVAATAPGRIRIIGGQWRRTTLAVPTHPGLRPTPQRVRETLFNWLGQDLSGLRCMDAFAGTGALGFEAASRGAAQVRLVEADTALVRGLERITAQLAAHERVHVQRGDGVAALRASASAHWHVIFLDPPFAHTDLLAQAIAAAAPALADGGWLYVECAQNLSTAPELAALSLQLHRHMHAGEVHAHVFRKRTTIA